MGNNVSRSFRPLEKIREYITALNKAFLRCPNDQGHYLRATLKGSPVVWAGEYVDAWQTRILIHIVHPKQLGDEKSTQKVRLIKEINLSQFDALMIEATSFASCVIPVSRPQSDPLMEMEDSISTPSSSSSSSSASSPPTVLTAGTTTGSTPTGTNEEDGLCCICMERNSDAVTICGHAFCSVCAQNWVSKKAECPMCRSQRTVDDIFEMPPDSVSITAQAAFDQIVLFVQNL